MSNAPICTGVGRTLLSCLFQSTDRIPKNLAAWGLIRTEKEIKAGSCHTKPYIALPPGENNQKPSSQLLLRGRKSWMEYITIQLFWRPPAEWLQSHLLHHTEGIQHTLETWGLQTTKEQVKLTGRSERLPESLARLTGGGLLIYEVSLWRLGEVAPLSNVQTPTQRVKEDEKKWANLFQTKEIKLNLQK